MNNSTCIWLRLILWISEKKQLLLEEFLKKASKPGKVIIHINESDKQLVENILPSLKRLYENVEH